MKRDLFNDEKRYNRWKENYYDDEISKKNCELIYQYVTDMEQGKNIGKGAKKGSRSYKRLNTLRIRMTFIAKMMERKKIDNLTKIKEDDIFELFDGMRKGRIKTLKGTVYKSVGDYVKVFKAFWHWWMKVNRKEGKDIQDITLDIDNSVEETSFVLLTKEDLDKFVNQTEFTSDERIIIRFVFDSLIRAPTEISSLQTKHIEQIKDTVWIHIPDEISKVKGRSVNLIYCGEDLIKYIKDRNLKEEDYLFNFSSPMINEKMQKVAEKIWGNKISHPKAKGLYKEITLYDLRHSGAVHFRRLAQKGGKISVDTIRERGGWLDFKMLNYYTKFIFLDGEIKKEDLLIEEDKTRLEKKIEEQEKKIKMMEQYFKKIKELQKIN